MELMMKPPMRGKLDRIGSCSGSEARCIRAISSCWRARNSNNLWYLELWQGMMPCSDTVKMCDNKENTLAKAQRLLQGKMRTCGDTASGMITSMQFWKSKNGGAAELSVILLRKWQLVGNQIKPIKLIQAMMMRHQNQMTRRSRRGLPSSTKNFPWFIIKWRELVPPDSIECSNWHFLSDELKRGCWSLPRKKAEIFFIEPSMRRQNRAARI